MCRNRTNLVTPYHRAATPVAYILYRRSIVLRRTTFPPSRISPVKLKSRSQRQSIIFWTTRVNYSLVASPGDMNVCLTNLRADTRLLQTNRRPLVGFLPNLCFLHHRAIRLAFDSSHGKPTLTLLDLHQRLLPCREAYWSTNTKGMDLPC